MFFWSYILNWKINHKILGQKLKVNYLVPFENVEKRMNKALNIIFNRNT